MKSLVLSQFPLIHLTIFALLLFFGFFCAMVLRVMSRRRITEFQDASRLPLEEGFHNDQR
jgi:cbb3-type cytochrome oxidase subunit 3